RRATHLRRTGKFRQVAVRRGHRPLLHHPGGPQREGRHDRQVDREAMALAGGASRKHSSLRVLAHFVPGDRVTEFLAPEVDWLDIRYCAEDDDDTFYRELPKAEVIWHVLRPISGDDLEKAANLKLVHKMGAGVNTIDVDTATRLGIAVANMPGANAPSVAEGT